MSAINCRTPWRHQKGHLPAFWVPWRVQEHWALCHQGFHKGTTRLYRHTQRRKKLRFWKGVVCRSAVKWSCLKTTTKSLYRFVNICIRHVWSLVVVCGFNLKTFFSGHKSMLHRKWPQDLVHKGSGFHPKDSQCDFVGLETKPCVFCIVTVLEVQRPEHQHTGSDGHRSHGEPRPVPAVPDERPAQCVISHSIFAACLFVFFLLNGTGITGTFPGFTPQGKS